MILSDSTFKRSLLHNGILSFEHEINVERFIFQEKFHASFAVTTKSRELPKFFENDSY